MASNRSRGNESLGGRLERINSKIARNEKRRSELVTNSVTEEALAPGAASGEAIPDGSVTGAKLARGAVTTENLGIVNTVYSDGDVTFVMPPDGTLNVDGGAYTLPAAGTSTAIRLNSVGELAPWTGSPAIATVDLNDYTVPGEYHQASNAQAAAGLNYPIGHAGSLTVKAADGGAFIYQTYHSYEDFNNLYFRGRYLGQWAPWAETVQATNPRLQATAPSVTGDWNNVLDTGFYRGSGLANKPGADDWYFMTVIRHDASYVTQTATSFRAASDNAMYTRTKENGTWSIWRQLLTGTPRTAFTPTFSGSGHTSGNAVRKGWYNVVAGRCFVEVLFNHGSTTVFGSALKVALPIAASTVYTELAATQYNLGVSRYLNEGVAGYPGGVSFNPSNDAAYAYFDRFAVSGSEIVTSGVSGSLPFAAGLNDDVTASFSYFID